MNFDEVLKLPESSRYWRLWALGESFSSESKEEGTKSPYAKESRAILSCPSREPLRKRKRLVKSKSLLLC